MIEEKIINLKIEFKNQIDNLLKKDYPKLIGLSEQEFIERIIPLEEKISSLKEIQESREGKLNFVIVINSEFISVEKLMETVNYRNKSGFVKLYPLKPENFKTISEIEKPKGLAYLLFDIDRGEKTLNLPPSEGFNIIKSQNRSPLTIDEGIAIITHYPDFLKKNNCFYLLGSRYTDLRIPAIWISEGKAKLGWCWNGNPHTWLGSASCKLRIS